MNKKLLIIGFVWPEPKSSAAGTRMLQLIALFQSEDYEVTFASPCSKTDNAVKLEHINVSQVEIKLNDSSFDDYVNQIQPDIVLFDRFMMEEQFGWRVAEQCPSALRVLDTEDLHCLRKGRHQAYKDGKAFDRSYLFNEFAKREIASIYRSDLSLIISEVEMKILVEDFKVDTALLCYLPFMMDELSRDAILELPKFQDREHFISIGNFLHEPNYNAVLYLKETIWPLIRQALPMAELHVYGAYASQKVNQLDKPRENFFVKGFAEDVSQVMQKAKVCIAPIRFGAGLKGKLVDAMVNGTPSITTTIGAEGMYGDMESKALIEDDPQEFANKAVELYMDEDLWKDQQENGYNIINKRFNKGEFQKVFMGNVEAINQDLNGHRQNNFTGSMLQHHLMQSTKFMSRWIEEKNKK